MFLYGYKFIDLILILLGGGNIFRLLGIDVFGAEANGALNAATFILRGGIVLIIGLLQMILYFKEYSAYMSKKSTCEMESCFQSLPPLRMPLICVGEDSFGGIGGGFCWLSYASSLAAAAGAAAPFGLAGSAGATSLLPLLASLAPSATMVSRTIRLSVTVVIVMVSIITLLSNWAVDTLGFFLLRSCLTLGTTKNIIGI